MTKLEVRGAPSYYACREDSLEDLENLLLSNRINHCLVIHGEQSWKATEPFFPNMPSVKLTFVPYNGECSLNEVKRISTIAKSTSIDAIIGIGGGKILDLTKAV